MNKTLIILALFSLSLNACPQDVKDFLQKVMEHHPGISAGRELLDSRRAWSMTGHTPPDPTVQIGYFPGIPESTGDKVTWSVSQSLDFPSVYRNIKKLREIDYEQAVMEYRHMVLSLLEEARAGIIEMTALKKHIDMSDIRLAHIGKMEKAYKKMLDEGEVTIIEYNKIRIAEAELENQKREYKASLEAVISHLDMMSGNNTPGAGRVAYPLFREPDPDKLLAERKQRHPAYHIPKKEIEIAQRNIELIKSEKLPELEIGYASEIVAASRFTGPSIGLSIPLWENKGRLSLARAGKAHSEAEHNKSMLIKDKEFNIKYNKYLSVKSGFESLESILREYKANELLNRALEEGEISLIEYFTELEEFYDAEDRLTELEKDYYSLLSSLYNHFPGLIIPGN